MDTEKLISLAQTMDKEKFIGVMSSDEMWSWIGLPLSSAKGEWLAQFWDASRRPIREVLDASRMTREAFAKHFCISVRTVNEWSCGGRGCPIYTNLLLQESLGMFKRLPE